MARALSDKAITKFEANRVQAAGQHRQVDDFGRCARLPRATVSTPIAADRELKTATTGAVTNRPEELRRRCVAQRRRYSAGHWGRKSR